MTAVGCVTVARYMVASCLLSDENPIMPISICKQELCHDPPRSGCWGKMLASKPAVFHSVVGSQAMASFSI
jgi:hypothetical protein